MRLSNLLMLGSAVLALGLPAAAMADSTSNYGQGPMVQVGAGADFHTGGLPGVLLEVQVTPAWGPPPGNGAGNVGLPPIVLLSHIDGQFEIDPAGPNGFPYMNISLEPIDIRMGNNVNGATIRFLPTQAGINVRLNEQFNLRISVLGLQYAFASANPDTSSYYFYAKFVADAAGYKFATLVQGNNFNGFDIAALKAEIGAVIQAAKNFPVRVAFGSSADFAVGGIRDTGAAGYIDASLYQEVSVDIMQFVRLFVRGTESFATDSAEPGRGEFQVVTGAEFLF